MITSTHMLMGALATTRPKMPGWLIALGWAGGFIPDASMFVMAGAARWIMAPGINLWRKPDGLYWVDPWQTLSDVSHSIPLWGVLCLIGYLIWRRSAGWVHWLGLGMLVFSGGALLHSVSDFLVHTDDAHAHFLPFTNWRFHSPISYYQPAHFGREFGVVELAFCIAAAYWIVRQFKQWPVRILAVLMLLPLFGHFGLMYFRPFGPM